MRFTRCRCDSRSTCASCVLVNGFSKRLAQLVLPSDCAESSSHPVGQVQSSSTTPDTLLIITETVARIVSIVGGVFHQQRFHRKRFTEAGFQSANDQRRYVGERKTCEVLKGFSHHLQMLDSLELLIFTSFNVAFLIFDLSLFTFDRMRHLHNVSNLSQFSTLDSSRILN